MLPGIVLLLISAFSFALSTALAKEIVNISAITPVEITFFRFSTGLLLLLAYMGAGRKKFRPNNFRLIALRAFFNTVAVVFFFMALRHTTVTKTNMLNMTYPLFVFLLSPFLNRERVSPLYYLSLAITMGGIYTILAPGNGDAFLSGVNRGDLFALVSGVLAAFAISFLRETRKNDQSYIILFYLMLIGTIINGLIVAPVFIIPRGEAAIILALCTAASLAGQFTITVGYRYISAAGGALVSSSRIVFAAVMGIGFFHEPLTLRIVGGGILIFLSLAGISGAFGRIPLFKWSRK